MDVKCRFRGESNIGVLVCLGFQILNKQICYIFASLLYLHLWCKFMSVHSIGDILKYTMIFKAFFRCQINVKCNVHTNHNTMIDGQHVMMVNDITIGRELWGNFKQLLRIIWLCLLGSCWIFNGNCRHDPRKTHKWTTFWFSTSSHPPYYSGIFITKLVDVFWGKLYTPSRVTELGNGHYGNALGQCPPDILSFLA